MSFRGDGDVMVDALIKASEEQKCASAEPLPGAGRDLVPFDFDAHNTNDDHNKVYYQLNYIIHQNVH